MDTKLYSIAQTKAHLSALLRDAAAGKDVVITEHNRPVARLVGINAIPPAPYADMTFLKKPRIRLKTRAIGSGELIRRIRDEE